jgi:hypothetical protein
MPQLEDLIRHRDEHARRENAKVAWEFPDGRAVQVWPSVRPADSADDLRDSADDYVIVQEAGFYPEPPRRQLKTSPAWGGATPILAFVLAVQVAALVCLIGWF